MDAIIQYLTNLDLNVPTILMGVGLLIGIILALALVGRFVFGKQSTLNCAISSGIGIIFIYVLTVVLVSTGSLLQQFLSPLPYVNIQADTMHLFSFQTDYTLICSQVLSMIILAALMNLVDALLPKGKKVIGWFFFRILSIALAMILHLVVIGLFRTYLPEGLVTYAPVILLAILVLMLLTGALKFLVGIILTSVNPLIAALYTFFFANIVGKQISKAILTTGLLTVLILALQKIGIVAVAISSAALVAFIPFLILLAVLWYLVGKLL